MIGGINNTNRGHRLNEKTGDWWDAKLLVSAVGSFLIVWAYLRYGLSFNFFRADVLNYWRDSLEWMTPFDPWHVPGYAFLIALVRALTFNLLPPLVIMWGISLVCYIVGMGAVFACLAQYVNREAARLGAMLFALWFFVGTVYAVYPVADGMALALIAVGLLSLLQKRFLSASLILGVALITHKSAWLFVGAIMLVALALHRREFRLTNFVILLLPLTVLWVAGAYFHSSPMWLLETSIGDDAETRSALPVLDGLIGTFIYGGMKGLLKGGVIAFVALIACALIVPCWRIKSKPIRWYSLAILCATLLLCVTLNQNTIWAALRFSKLLALPLVWSLAERLPVMSTTRPRAMALIGVLLLILLATQFAYAWYIARVFYA